jgi:hypothetical protein
MNYEKNKYDRMASTLYDVIRLLEETAPLKNETLSRCALRVGAHALQHVVDELHVYGREEDKLEEDSEAMSA